MPSAAAKETRRAQRAAAARGSSSIERKIEGHALPCHSSAALRQELEALNGEQKQLDLRRETLLARMTADDDRSGHNAHIHCQAAYMSEQGVGGRCGIAAVTGAKKGNRTDTIVRNSSNGRTHSSQLV